MYSKALAPRDQRSRSQDHVVLKPEMCHNFKLVFSLCPSRSLPRPDPRPKINTPSYQNLENTLSHQNNW